MKDSFWLFEIGGSRLRYCRTEAGAAATAVRATVQATPTDYREALALVGGLDRQGADEAVVAVAGLLNSDQSGLVSSPNLLDWVGRPLRRDLSSRLHCPVKLINDAAAGGLGEAIFGAGRGVSVLAYLTLGTGLGGARLTNGQLDATAAGFEPGQMLLGRSASAAGAKAATAPTTFESLLAGAALHRRYGRSPEEITDAKAWRRWHDDLADLLVNVTVMWSPTGILLGGGLAARVKYPFLRAGIRARLGERYAPLPVIKTGRLDDRAALLGALVLAGADRVSSAQ